MHDPPGEDFTAYLTISANQARHNLRAPTTTFDTHQVIMVSTHVKFGRSAGFDFNKLSNLMCYRILASFVEEFSTG